MASTPNAKQIQEAGVSAALDSLAGPFGLRRFVIHFELVGAKIRIMGLDAVPLRMGGGPPPPDLNGQRMEALSQALGRLYRATTSTSQGWHRGAIGYTRDARGKVHLYPLFDDETDGARVDKLPMPGPPAHPLETPEYLRLRESLIAPCRQIHARSYNRGQDWEDWEIKDDTQLLLHLAFKSDGSPERSRTHSCQVLGTFEPTWNRFTWRTEQPLFTEQVFNLGDFGATYDAAMELALVTAARLGAEWLFVQPIDDRDTVLLVAVFT